MMCAFVTWVVLKQCSLSDKSTFKGIFFFVSLWKCEILRKLFVFISFQTMNLVHIKPRTSDLVIFY